MTAIFSPCGSWRYWLGRPIGTTGPIVAFNLHNPSTAGADNDDPTSTRGVNYATAWGASHLIYVNPFAGVATKKSELWKMADPVGPDNLHYIGEAARLVAAPGGFMVLAWGAVVPPRHMAERVAAHLREVEALVRSTGCPVRALGLTKDGAPRHPLFMRADAQPVPFWC